MLDIPKLNQAIDEMIANANEEINELQTQVTRLVIEQVAIFAHDNIQGFPMTFGTLSNSQALDKETESNIREGSAELSATLIDREQRRNALIHLKKLLTEGNERAIQTLQTELDKWGDPKLEAIISPHKEHPSGEVKPYPYK